MKTTARQRTTAKYATLATALLAFSSASAANSNNNYSGELKEAWLDGRIETAYMLNRHLNPFTIDVDVDGDIATLSGEVESDIDRDLAEQIAMNVDGIAKVRNELEVREKSVWDETRASVRTASNKFLQAVEDATTTAIIKSKLVANENTRARDINVDTKNDVVSLSGEVSTTEEENLAVLMAENTANVEKVKSKLKVSNQ